MVVQGLASTVHAASRARLLDALRGVRSGAEAPPRPAGMDAETDRGLVDLLKRTEDTPPARGAERPAPADRAELLASIRKRIRKGFYNTEAVLDDLSDSFAGVFDKLT